MGMESFFINLKLINIATWGNISSVLNARSYEVKILTNRKLSFHKKRISGDIKAVINKLVLVEYNEKDAVISLQACFSCYERARNMIIEIVRELSSSGIIQYIYYGSTVIEKQEFDHLEAFINKFTENKKYIFHARYGNIQADLLPDEFYRYIINHKFYTAGK